jgi:serine/threonine-protein kinase
MRLLFASIHGDLDPSGGAALSTRELRELLAARGADCRALTAGALDDERETSLGEVLAGLDLPSQRFRADLGHPVVARSPNLATSVKVIELTVGGVRDTLMRTASSRTERSPDMQESARFLDLADQVLERFRPQVLLTYGGHPACLELMRGARMKSVAVVFLLQNSVTMSAASLTTSGSPPTGENRKPGSTPRSPPTGENRKPGSTPRSPPAKTGNRARPREALRPAKTGNRARPREALPGSTPRSPLAIGVVHASATSTPLVRWNSTRGWNIRCLRNNDRESAGMEVELVVVEGPHQGRTFTFREHDSFIVGRGKEAHFRLPREDQYFSRHHFLIEVNPPKCRLLDLASTNGTRVNARKVRSADLKEGDLIKGGITTIRVAIKEIDSAFKSVTGPGNPERFQPEQIQVLAPEPPQAPGSEPPDQGMSEGRARFLPESPQEPATPNSAQIRGEPPPPFNYSTWRPPGDRLEVSLCPVCGKSVPGRGTGRDASVCPECQDQIRRQDQPIGGYRIVRELGRGGMSVVYLALHEQQVDLVALKMIIPEVNVSPQDVQRFLREASILQQLNHPHVVAFRDMGESRGQIYFAMEYVSGVDAARLVHDNNGPLPIPRAVELVCQMLEALEYAHARKFVHRDIKPSNLMVKPSNGQDFAMLTDFGLARVYQASRMSGLTMIGEIGGTPAFMAPEQVTHFREAKPAADQYSAAATLYFLLTGSPPYNFQGRLKQRILAILQDDPVPVRERRKDIPPDLARIIHTSLAKEPGERFATAGAMRAALIESQDKERRGRS